MVTVTPVDENNKDVFSFESLVGQELLKDVKGPPVSTTEAFKSKPELVALYFSASWCPPCQRFTPILTEFYNAASKAKSGLEIVFISSDRDMKEFEGYYGKMPWLSIPPVEGSAKIKGKLAETLGIRAIPALAVLDGKTGEFILGGEARDDVINAGGDADAVAATLQKWKESERLPLSEGPRMMEMGSGQQHPIFKFISWLAKNPMIIFGLIYFYKWMQRKMIEVGFDDPPATAPEPESLDTEF